MSSVEFDFSELTELAVTIEGADTKVRRNTRKAIERAAFVGKKEWARRAKAKGGVHLPAYPHSIDYDIDGVGSGNTSGEISAEVGPSLGRNQGALGIVEDAPGGVRASPQRNYEPAVKAMQEDLTVGVLKAVGADGFGGDA